jgi:short-subunit dehydrogenase
VIAADSDDIHTAATTLKASGVEVEPVQVDLRKPKGVEKLYQQATAGGRQLDAAALNAGTGQGGKFVDTPLEADLNIIDLNVRSTVHLAKLVLRDMVPRDSGKVLLTSSVVSMMPGPYQPIYNASKSFVQSFAEALRAELNDSNVSVTSLMPGPTDTNFFHRAEMDDTKMGAAKKDDPAQVAQQGFEALMKDKEKVVAGSAKTKAQGAMSKVLPDRAKAEMHRKMAEPGSAPSE